ncbi:MAG: DUF5995 family protein [Saprospiraceae bacterium]
MKTIDEVLHALDEIIDQCITDENPVGVFAALYRTVTAEVKKGILNNRFADGPRMEKLDVIFAKRFIDAWVAYSNNTPTTQSWKIAFDSARRSDLYPLQHIFLGMNAHINLDLGIAAAETAPSNSLLDLENDFMEINVLLSEMTEVVQNKLGSISPIMAWLDRMAKNRDEQIAGFSLVKARDHAWNVANLLAPIPTEEWGPVIDGVDQQIAKVGSLITKPSGILWRLAYRIINFFEHKPIVDVIKRLRN